MFFFIHRVKDYLEDADCNLLLAGHGDEFLDCLGSNFVHLIDGRLVFELLQHVCIPGLDELLECLEY